MAPEQNQLPTLETPDLPAETPVNDDGGSAHGFDQPAAAAQPKQQAEEASEPEVWVDEKRAAIVARAREKRAAETTPFSGDANDPNAIYGSEVDQSELGPLELEALRRRKEHLEGITGEQQPQQPQPQQQPRKPLNGLDPQLLATPVPIIIDGQQYEVPMEDLVRDFQINRAADKRLALAKSLLAQSQEFQQTRPQPGRDAEIETSGQDDSTQDQDFERELGHTSRRPANVKDLAEKIQLGTPDEVAEAIEEFISSAGNRETPVDETTRVQMALEDINTKQAVTAFAQANPHLANNEMLQQVARKVIHRNMAEDLLRAGYTMDDLREHASTPQHLTQLHKHARIAGLKGVRRVSDLINAGYQGAISEVRRLADETTAAPTGQHRATMEQRQQRKESLQPQPAARRLSPSLANQQPARSQEQSRQAAFARMRQQRGQPI